MRLKEKSKGVVPVHWRKFRLAVVFLLTASPYLSVERLGTDGSARVHVKYCYEQ